MLTIIIPTMNRPEFVVRLLRYYAQEGLPYQLFIVDSSDVTRARQITDAVDRYAGQIAVTYHHRPGSVREVVAFASAQVTTPYATLLPDDDFFTVSGLRACVEFLEAHPDYVAANGLAAQFALDQSGAYGRCLDVGGYRLGSLEDPDPALRLVALLDHYFVVLFSVHRTPVWKAMWERGGAISSVAFGAELLPNCTSTIHGKTKQLNGLYLMRQSHDRRYLLPDIYDQITSDGFPASYRSFETTLTQSLMEASGASEVEARDCVKRAFYGYLNAALSVRFQAKYGKKKATVADRLKSALRKSSLAHAVKRRVRTIQGRLTLEGLTNPASRFHRDFQPIYELITGSSSD